jgi:hypothetical protein
VPNSVLGTCQLCVGPRRIRHSKPLLGVVAAGFIITDPLVLTPKTELPRYRVYTNRACTNRKKLRPKYLLRKAIAKK